MLRPISSRSSAAWANPLILRLFCLSSPMSRHAAPSLRRSRYPFTPNAACCPTCPVCARARSPSPSYPLTPWKRRYRFATLPCTGRMWVRTHTRDFEHLADSKVRRTTISWRESSSSSPNTSSGDPACGLTGGGFFHDSPGGPSPRRRFPGAAMSAPGLEHGRFNALVRGSMEHANRYTKEIGTPKRVTRGTPTTGCARK